MQLQCAHCPYIAKSLLLIKDEALAEITLNFSNHLIEKHSSKNVNINTPHKAWMIDIQMLMQIVPCVIMLSKHSTLLNEDSITDTNKNLIDDDYIQKKFSEMIDKVQDMLGVEVFDNRPAEKPLTLPQMT